MNREVQLSVIIVNYNVKYFLEQCLYSVQAAIEGLAVEVIVVDNHSQDNSVEYLKPIFPDVIFIENQSNPGFSKANNQAIRQSKGKYVLLLNPDTVIGEHILCSLCLFMDEHPEAGGLGVKMIDGYGTFLPESKRSFPTPWVSFCKLFGLTKLFPGSRLFSAYSLLYLDPDKQHQVEVLSGAFMFLRRAALDKVGFLDESFFMYGEDIDLSYRIVLGGYKNYYFPERILHYKGESTKRGDKKFIKAFYGAMLIFYKKYYPNSSILLSGIIRFSIFLRGAFSALFEREKENKMRTKSRHLLFFCKGEHSEQIVDVTKQKIPELISTDIWDLNDKQITDVKSEHIQLKAYTDIVFYYPDVSFNQLLLFMDQISGKKILYHIYHSDSKQLISSGK